jgi:hypothetical protein
MQTRKANNENAAWDLILKTPNKYVHYKANKRKNLTLLFAHIWKPINFFAISIFLNNYVMKIFLPAIADV